MGNGTEDRGVKDTGGPAFPQTSDDEDGNLYEKGMTLRDYFAAKAMQGLLADTQIKGRPEEFAERAYELADAMLAERNK